MELRINGAVHSVDADPDTPLLWVLRDNLGMTGTKYGCGVAQCGACSVMLDGAIARACVTPIDSLGGREITTIEAVEQDPVGGRVVAAWVKHQAPQCGYCQSGQVMAATALLKEKAQPSDDEIAAAMVNLCRCGTYNAIKAAMQDLAGRSQTADAEGAGLIAAAGGALAVVALGGVMAAAKAGRDDEEVADA